MSNMSYCRFENTRGDMSDCIEALATREADLSLDEYRAARGMLSEVIDFFVDEGIVDEADVNLLRLGNLLDECREQEFGTDDEMED